MEEWSNEAKECRDHRTGRSKIEDQFGFRKGKGTGDAIGLMRNISERVLDIKEEMCLCFIDWQKTLQHVD